MSDSQYPKTLAAVEREAATKVERMFGIGDALLVETRSGEGSPDGDAYHDGSTEKFKAAAVELAARGYTYSPDYLRQIRDTAAAYPKAERWDGVAWTVFYELRSKRDLFDALASVLDGERPKTVSAEAQKLIRNTGRVTVDAMRVATIGRTGGGPVNKLTPTQRTTVAQEEAVEHPEEVLPSISYADLEAERRRRLDEARRLRDSAEWDDMTAAEREEATRTDEALAALSEMTESMTAGTAEAIKALSLSSAVQRLVNLTTVALPAVYISLRKDGIPAAEEGAVEDGLVSGRKFLDLVEMLLQGVEMTDSDRNELAQYGISAE